MNNIHCTITLEVVRSRVHMWKQFFRCIAAVTLVCICVCVYICLCVYVYVSICVCACMRACVRACARASSYTFTFALSCAPGSRTHLQMESI